MQNKAHYSMQGAEHEQKRDLELRELREMNEAKRDEIYSLKTELNLRQQKLKELEAKSDQRLKEK